MNTLTEHGYHKAMSSKLQDRVTKYEDNIEMLLNRIVALERRLAELEKKDCGCK